MFCCFFRWEKVYALLLRVHVCTCVRVGGVEPQGLILCMTIWTDQLALNTLGTFTRIMDTLSVHPHLIYNQQKKSGCLIPFLKMVKHWTSSLTTSIHAKIMIRRESDDAGLHHHLALGFIFLLLSNMPIIGKPLSSTTTTISRSLYLWGMTWNHTTASPKEVM